MKVKLGDIAILINGDRGKNYPSQADIMEDGEIPFVNAGHLTGREVCFDDMNYISKEKYDRLNAGKFHKGDILYCLRGSLGKKALVKDKIEGAIASSLVIIRTNDEIIDRDYLMFALDSPSIEEQLIKANNGSSQPNLSAASVKQYEIDLPDLRNQAEIAERLLKARKVIDIRKQELQKLDELIKARFVELFGDDAKYKKEPLIDNVQEMFIGPFGSALKNEYFVDEADSYCMVYEQKHAIQKNMNLPTRYVDEAKYNELKRFTVIGGDIIVSCRGTIGEIYSVPDDAPMGIMHPSIMKIRLKKEKYCNLFFVLMLDQYMQENIAKANGSGIKMAVTATDLGKELFVVPAIEEQRNFENFVLQVDKSKVAVQKSLEETQLLFDSLMQKYFG